MEGCSNRGGELGERHNIVAVRGLNLELLAVDEDIDEFEWGRPVTPTQDGSPECRRADRSLARMQVMCGTLGVTGHVESTTHVRITDAGFEVWVRMHHAARGDAACTVGDWYAWRHVGKEALLGAQVASEWAKLGPSPSSYGDVDH